MGLVQTVKTARMEITAKLMAAGWQLPLAGALPAALLVGLGFWFVEIFAASVGLRVPQAVAGVFALLVSFTLVALILSRMLGLLLRPYGGEARPGALRFTDAEARVIGAVFLFAGVCACLVGGILFSEHLVSRAFFVAGSEAIAGVVAAFGRSFFLIGGLYVCARGSLLLSSAVLGAPGPGKAWAATDEDASLLLILIWVLPVLVFLGTGGAALYASGVWGWADTPMAEWALRASRALHAYWWAVLPAVWLSLLGSFSLMSVGLAIAHEHLIPATVEGLETGTPPVDEAAWTE